MYNIIDMTGKKVGRLTVLERAGSYVTPEMGKYVATWKCKCECGNICIVRGDSLRREAVRSCGCLRKETFRENKKKRKYNYKRGESSA